MDQNRLYYQYPYVKRFMCTVTDCRESKKGTWLVRLDQTAFYPEGGGQPSDRGTLGEASVLSVHEKNGAIDHEVDRPLAPGTMTEGIVDWQYRLDNMQQHTGEHILSGLIHSRFGYDNVGFHMGAEEVTVDFNGLLTKEDLVSLEDAANALIYENVGIRVFYPSEEERKSLDYRSKKELTGQVRIVTFPGADCCACCGTHVRSAGQVGLIKLLTVQKFRDGVRIELVCGRRALRYVNQILEQNRQVSHLLSAKPFETGAAVERLLAENEGHKARCARLEEDRFAALARQYAGAGDVVLFEEGLSPDALRRLCDAVLRACGGRCACLSGGEGAGWQYAVGAPDRDLRPLAKEMNAALGGRGGGKPDFIQGILQADRARIEAFFHTH